MKILILMLIMLLTGCNEQGQGDVSSADNDVPVSTLNKVNTSDKVKSTDDNQNISDDDQNEVDELPSPTQGSANVVTVYPLQSKYLNGLRDSITASNILTRDEWESLCISENNTGKDYAFPMASVQLLEKVGFASEDQDYATYIRNTWLYGIDLVNADVSDQDGSLISTGLDWLTDQSTNVNFNFLPADSALYFFQYRMISAGHPYRSDGSNVGTLVHNTGDIKSMFNTDNSIEVHFYCLAF